MRKFLALAVVAIMAVSCSTMFNAPAKMERQVNKMERYADKYNSYDWQRQKDKFNGLVQEYIDNYKVYTADEKRTAMNAIGRYHSLLVEHGAESALNVLQQIQSYADGLKEILKYDRTAVVDFLTNVLGLNRQQVESALGKLGQ